MIHISDHPADIQEDFLLKRQQSRLAVSAIKMSLQIFK